MTTLAGPGAASTGPQAAQRLRAVVLGPRGGGTTRRRASDAFRLGLAVVVVAVSIPVMRANSAAELGIVHAVNPLQDMLSRPVVRVVSDDASRDLPPMDDAIDANGRVQPVPIALAFARAPLAAIAFVRDVRSALGVLTETARAINLAAV